MTTLTFPVPELAAYGKPRVVGRVTGVVGLAVSVSGITARVGDLVHIGPQDAPLPAEVVSLSADRVVCLPLGPLDGIGIGQPVVNTGHPLRVVVGEGLRGRVLDGLGEPMDGGPAIVGRPVTVEMPPPSALERGLIREPLQLGVRALDTAVPCGRGQRVGIFAGSGVGKSSLLSMITRGTSAQITVVALIGERGREVREFLEHDLGPEGLARSVVVVATSDQPPLVRLRAGFVATRIAEWYRDQGMDVLLLMDSLTRIATAQREVGLSAGEPPATRGYPPSVFALMPRLLERAGPASKGSITGLYTVLVEGDDHNEPIADTARSILDGHIVLTRALATAAHFPSVDVLESVSRVAGAVTTPEQRADLSMLRRLLAAHRDVRELVEIGAYAAGSNPDADRALALWPRLMEFLRQDMDDRVPSAQSWAALRELLHGTETR
ncbi:flagellar protein export ATPase FliI [Saccharothrix violaceirubra]|uniref:Flagellum-specific ATP synthase n=1 Tax=Saccharothrix violaceirubra TaxID=413306 RepID=A0A7W7T878_9PSEU|nr:FliI/YscN family ATPase [Saccharothrix violaceirubra]MBB4968363.1 flagellum-specific ATP synthase [Saccharothrix violaceirubra]